MICPSFQHTLSPVPKNNRDLDEQIEEIVRKETSYYSTAGFPGPPKVTPDQLHIGWLELPAYYRHDEN